MSVKDLSAYELVKEEELKGIKSHGMLLKHKKSGARILLIENDDDNKVFNIGFRTPPSDSTGVPHIMEHSVLCGSKNFPAGFIRSQPQRRPIYESPRPCNIIFILSFSICIQ